MIETPMKTLLIPLALVASFAMPSIAATSQQTIDQANQLRDTLIQGHLGYDIVESLTVEVGPRIAGSSADARAVAWAEHKFNQLGFDKVYKQPVTVKHWQRGSASAQVTAPFPQPLAITALGGSIATPKDGITGEVVFFDSVKALQAADDATVAGKIVYIDARMHRHREGKEYGLVVAGRAIGATTAASKGAIGLLIRSVGTDKSRMPHTGGMRHKAG